MSPSCIRPIRESVIRYVVLMSQFGTTYQMRSLMIIFRESIIAENIYSFPGLCPLEVSAASSKHFCFEVTGVVYSNN